MNCIPTCIKIKFVKLDIRVYGTTYICIIVYSETKIVNEKCDNS